VKTLVHAAYVATMDGPLLENAAIVIQDGRIAEVGRCQDLLRPRSDDDVIDFGWDFERAIILPGLVNAHTHLELTDLGQLPRPSSFVDWILRLRARAASVLSQPDQVGSSTMNGVLASVSFGVTAVGDVTLNPAITRPLLQYLHGASFGEVLGMAGRAAQVEERIAAAVAPIPAELDLTRGIEPHAPYSLDLAGYRRCIEEAKRRNLPLATHLAETPDEAEFLASHSGPFRQLWETIGGWQEDVSRAEGGPIRAMLQIGLFDCPTLLAHVNYVDDDELDVLARGQASVVYCPRTHDYFGHPPHRFDDMLARGINVGLGTDSAASSPDLNLMDDLRLVHRKRPDVSIQTLFEMATARGARALGLQDQIGTLSRGKSADFVIFEISSADPLRELLENNVTPRETWMRGMPVSKRIRQAAAP
jgi:cytosine/adenosine deaminase-related metal-dependent hydrolase